MTKDTEALQRRSAEPSDGEIYSLASFGGDANAKARFVAGLIEKVEQALATPASDVAPVDVMIGNFIAQYDEGAAGCLLDVDDAQALAREFKRMQGLIYCPGVLRCAKCDFRLIKTTLTPAGAFANEEPDSCPNCNVPMWRVTWQDEAHQAYRVAESQMERALGAEKKLAHPPLAQSVDPALLDRAETAWQRFFYPANDCFDTSPAANKLPFVDVEVADCLRLLLSAVGHEVRPPAGGEVSIAHPVDPVAGEALREALRRAALRLEICAGYIDSSFGLSGTRRAERAMKAKHFALEALAALKGPAA